MDHPDPGCQRGAGIARGQGGTEGKYFPAIGHVMAEKDVHERRLACAVLSKKRQYLALLQGEVDAVVGEQRAEALRDPPQVEDQVLDLARVRAHDDDVGSLSLISTVKLPSRIAACRSATSAMAASGTLPSKVPSGESEEPPFFM